MEGDSGADCPAILTGATEEDLEKRMTDNVIAISGIIAEKLDQYGRIPAFNCLKEVENMVDVIEKATEAKKQEADVILTIDGVEVPMVPFVKNTLRNVVIGAVKALDGYEEGKEILIRVKE